MEVIRKTILQAVTTGATACTGTTGTCFVIIPDTTAVYNIKININSEIRDIGFLDAYTGGTIPYGGTEPVGGGNIGEEEEATIPTVRTGVATWTTLFYFFSGHTLLDDGGASITEYGTLYTFSSSYGNAGQLTYENKDNPVIDELIFTSLTLENGDTFGGKFFTEAGTMYYRAFAKNSEGVGYGLVKSITLPEIGGLIREDPEPEDDGGDTGGGGTTPVDEEPTGGGGRFDRPIFLQD
jgi:hypothetical protein